MRSRISSYSRLILLLALLGLLAVPSGCANGGEPRIDPPEWTVSHSTGRFDERTHLVGKGSSIATSNPVADARAALDQARSDLLSKVVVHVRSDFFSRISEYRVGSTWTESSETVSRVNTSVAGTLSVPAETEYWTDHRTRRVYAMTAISRQEYVTKLNEDLGLLAAGHRRDLESAGQSVEAGRSLEALRTLLRVESSVPEYLTVASCFRAAALGRSLPATPATPERIAALRRSALEGCTVQVEATTDGHDVHAREVMASVVRAAGMTVIEGGGRYALRLQVDGSTRETVLQPGWPGVAHGRYGWRVTLVPVHGGRDLSIVEESSSSPDRAVAHNGPLAELPRIRRESVELAAARAARVLAARLASMD